jgi:hypothetical protein
MGGVSIRIETKVSLPIDPSRLTGLSCADAREAMNKEKKNVEVLS